MLEPCSAGGHPPAELFVVLGLGNPGETYARTRHNLGFMVVRNLVGAHGIKERKGHPLALLNHGEVVGVPVLLARPRTFMNLSGRAAAWLQQSRQVPPERMLVVVDDMSLPLGQIRLRPRGSAGGHNGLKSIIGELGTSEFPRLRLGIGAAPQGVDSADYVLNDFLPEEVETVATTISEACSCVEAWITEGVDRAMSRFNRPKDEPPEENSPQAQEASPDPG